MSEASRASRGGWWPWQSPDHTSLPGAAPDSDARRDYALTVLEMLARSDELHARWLEASEEERRTDRLANAAAVYYWYLSGLSDRLATLPAPAVLAPWHEALAAALAAAARAARQISQGYRFHDVRRICDGGVLLEEARAQAAAVRAALAPLAEPPPGVGPTSAPSAA